MSHILSTLVPNLAYFDPELTGLGVQGANLAFAQFLKSALQDERVERLEAFIPPTLMGDRAGLERALESAPLGKLAFYPYHAMPDIWADGKPRIYRGSDPMSMSRERYLRDRFSQGPTPICCDTNLHGEQASWIQLRSLAAAPPVPYDSIVSIGHAHAEATRRLFDGFLGSQAPCRIDVIARSIDTEIFRPADPERKKQIRAELGWPVNAQIALYLGRVTPYGKAELSPLVRAFSEVCGPDDLLVIAGKEDTRGTFDRLRTTAKECGIQDRLVFAGPIAPAQRWRPYAASDLFVYPGDAIHEAFGMTVLEAMASGLPVVVSDKDGFRDQVTEGQEGFLIPTYWVPALDRVEAFSPLSPLIVDYLLVGQCILVDRPTLALRLGELLESPELRAKMGAAARRRSLDFETAKIMDRTVALWDEQAELALRETLPEREARRAYACQLGLPTPYLDLFSHSSSGILSEHTMLRFTEYGAKLLMGEAKLALYDETSALIDTEALLAVLKHLAANPNGLVSFAELCEIASDASVRYKTSAHYCIAILLKNDVLEIAG